MSSNTKSYKDLLVWQKGWCWSRRSILTRNFPRDERFGLVTQMRRAAVFVPPNIAEGRSRHTRGEFIQFLSHAEGALAELERQIIIAVDLSFWAQAHAAPVLTQVEELQKMLNGLRQKLATSH